MEELIIEYLTGETDAATKEKLLSYLEQSEANRRLFRAYKDLYDAGGMAIDAAESRTDEQWRRFEASSGNDSSIPRLVKTMLRYAAVFLLGIGCFAVYSHLKKSDLPAHTTLIETATGDHTQLTLPDGTKVWMNACSSLSYDNNFGRKDRSVTLKGEAYFEVAHDKSKPFTARTKHLTCHVTGTSFNMYSFEDEANTSVALLEGSVNIKAGAINCEIAPGEMFVYDKDEKTHTVNRTDVDLMSAWRRGEFVFDNMPFVELAKRLERIFAVRFVFENEEIKKVAFGGTFRSHDTIETIMRVITAGYQLDYQIKERTITIK